MAKKSVAAKKKNVAAKPMPKKSRMAAKNKKKRSVGWRGNENILKYQKAIRMGDVSYFIFAFICQLLNLMDGIKVKGLPSTVTVQSLESTHGKGTFAITNINGWGEKFNMSRIMKSKSGGTIKVSAASEMIARLNRATFLVRNESDHYYERNKNKQNDILTDPECRVIVEHVPQYSNELKRNVQIHANVIEEEALAVRLISHVNKLTNPQPAYDKLNKIKFRVTKKRKGKKDVITEVDSASMVSKVVNGGNKKHCGLYTYVHSNVYQEFVDCLGDSSREAKGILWPIGNPTDYVNDSGVLKDAFPKKMNNDYYKIECFIRSA